MLRSQDSAPGIGCRHPLMSFPSGNSARLLPDVLSLWCLLLCLSVCVPVHICNSLSSLCGICLYMLVCMCLYVCECISTCARL